MAPTHYIFMLLHSFRGSPKSMLPFKRVIEKHFSSCEILTPDTAIAPFSTTTTDEIINKLLSDIDTAWNNALSVHKGIPVKIIFIGHSLGALFARKVYVCACGPNQNAPLEDGLNVKGIRPWAEHVERIILMAGMNNGWHIDYHVKPGNAFLMTIGSQLGMFMSRFGRKPFMLSIKRGGPFITQLRLQTIEMLEAAANKGVGNALTIQLLGTSDDLVSPADNIDLACGGSFIYLEMPYSGHKNVIDINDPRTVSIKGESTTLGEARTNVITHALVTPESVLRSEQEICPPFKPIIADRSVTDVVFVIHGIRDQGFWTNKIANRVVQLGNKIPGRKYATETSTYGYFPLLHFTLPSTRNAKVEWLMERYAQNKVKYPCAKFSFIGHSNGTFLLAKALTEYKACHFNHVLFAGSVVSSKFDWQSFLQAGRVKTIHNIAATNDWVVGIFPQAFHYLFFPDLGAAGYYGFDRLPKASQTITIPGAHSAAIDEKYWDDIACYITEGAFKSPLSVDAVNRRFIYSPFIAILFLMLGVSLLLIGAIAVLRWKSVGEYRLVLLMVYLFIVWKFLTRF